MNIETQLTTMAAAFLLFTSGITIAAALVLLQKFTNHPRKKINSDESSAT